VHLPLHILIVPDKFKGTASAAEISRTAETVLHQAFPEATIECLPLADGGDGFTRIMCAAANGQIRSMETLDPLGRPVQAQYGELSSTTAITDLAEASGIRHLTPAELNPELTSNEGTGKLLQHLVEQGFTEIIVGLGGSSTTDGGIGLVAPLGFRFLNEFNKPIPLTGGGLAQLHRIVPPDTLPDVKWTVATDVNNPLYGSRGAAYQFAPQKGANEEQVGRLDRNLRHLAEIVQRDLRTGNPETPGAGAAGGCGYGLMAFLGAEPASGFELFSRQTGLQSRIARADLVVTGEGCYDGTSSFGKGPAEIASLAAAHQKPVWLLCGTCRSQDASQQFEQIIQVTDAAPDLESALADPLRYLAEALQAKLRSSGHYTES
jgi:glycerate kinase